MPKKKEEKATQEEEIQEEPGVITYPDKPSEEEEEARLKEVEEGEVEEEEGEEEAEDEKTKEKEKPKDKPKFTFEDAKKEGEEEEEDPEKIEIIHKGQTYKLTKAEVINLAQKGFDYDVKVGPHGKLAQMIATDPGLAQVVNNYWQGKMSVVEKPEEKEDDFKVKPLADYDDEQQWLKDNIDVALKAQKDSLLKEIPAAPQQDTGGSQIETMLKMRDPANYKKVIPKLLEYVPQLSVKDYQRIDTDPAALFQFYDFIKNEIVGDGQEERQPQKDNPSFKVRSGGGDAPREEEKKDFAWNLPKDKFRAQMEKIKGFG